MDLKGSKTEKNLYRAFAGESRARNKYSLYAEKARQEGYQWVGNIFDLTALNELAHARRVYKDYLKLVCNTKENLVDAICGETDEFKNIYAKFEQEAREEGFIDIANFFKELREVEEDHAKREVENHGCDPRNPGDIFTCFCDCDDCYLHKNRRNSGYLMYLRV